MDNDEDYAIDLNAIEKLEFHYCDTVSEAKDKSQDLLRVVRKLKQWTVELFLCHQIQETTQGSIVQQTSDTLTTLQFMAAGAADAPERTFRDCSLTV